MKDNHDITERKIANKTLQESEEQFRGVFEHANIGIATAGLDGKISNVNKEFENLLGYKKEELTQMTFADFTHPEDVNKEYALIKEMLDGKRDSYRIEKRYIHKAGDVIWVDLSIAGMRDEAGELNFFVGMVIDVTDRKKAEEESFILAEMLDAAPNPIMIHDESGAFLYANQRTFEIHGYEPEEFMALRLDEVDVPESAELIEERVKIIKERGYAVFEVAHLKKDGGRIPFEIYVKTVSWKGSPAMLSIATDISERKRWIKELISAKEKAEEANRLKTEFLNNMSHEIRTPMNGIIGFSKLLDRSDISEEKKSYFLKIIQNSSQQLLRVIDDILEISILETKQVKIYETDFCLNDFLMELFSIFNLKSKALNVPVYLKKGLHDKLSEIISDKTKLNKILCNLLENALKFTSKGDVEFGYYLEKKNLVFYVKDTGVGISNENHQAIFERFSQEDTEISSKHGGLGLGLSISRENALLLGGDITLESEKGVGSTFFLTIPYKPGRNLSSEQLQSIENSSEEEMKVDSKLTILVAEDEEVNFMFIEALFEDESDIPIELIHAKNGKEAVDICMENKNIDLVLMDIKMPVMSGLEATEKIKSKFPDLPVIAQTAYSTEADKEVAYKHGCDAFISKPINREKLFSLIRNYSKFNEPPK